MTRFRAEVVGSLLRPAYLKQARAALEQGAITTHAFKRVEDRAVDQVIALQEGVGLDVVTDGEMRRFSFLGPIAEAVDGLEPVPGGLPMPWMSDGGTAELRMPIGATSKLRKRRSVVCEEFSYARGQSRLPLKATVPSALSLYGLWDERCSASAYPDPFEMFADCGEIGRSEIVELARLGCEYIQIDAPELATLVDPKVRDWAEAKRMPTERMLTEGIELINAMVQDIPGVRFGIHLCRGNSRGRWLASGGYDYIAGALFERATAFDTFMLEYDDSRSGNFEPLSLAPDDKQIVLGLISTKSGRKDTHEQLVGRINEATQSFPREQLGLSTQCGFASAVAGNPIAEAVEERKLRMVAEVAHAVWG